MALILNECQRECNLLNMHKYRSLTLILCLSHCARLEFKPKPKVIELPTTANAPEWIWQANSASDKLCGLGVAGPGFHDSPYPKENAKERGIRNLAGLFETQVLEAMIDESTTHGQSIETAKVILVNDDILAQIAERADTIYWLDKNGIGPFGQKDFTYASTCLSKNDVLEIFQLDTEKLSNTPQETATTVQDKPPTWLKNTGKQAGGRLCTTGFSMPMFNPDQMFGAVVDDIRGQLASSLESLVSSYYEESTTDTSMFVEAITLATNEAISRGVLVSHFWYDKQGRGPHKKKRTTYGWGCIHAQEILKQTFAKAQEKLPEKSQQQVLQQVKEHAEQAFLALETEAAKLHKNP